MIEKNTVFVLGAGASVPYDYPTGEKLRRDIVAYFKNHFVSTCNIGVSPDDLKGVEKFINDFDGAPGMTIDSFLSRWPKHQALGKEAILFAIYQAELKSKIAGSARVDIHEDWFSYLFNLMISKLKDKDGHLEFQDNKISFVTFNYDRSLEYFLYNGLKSSFQDCSHQNAENILKTINIYHVYGQIMPLGFNGYIKSEGWDFRLTSLPYRYDGVKAWREYLNNIKVIQEDRDASYEHIHGLIGGAEQIFILGFGFDDDNLGILKIPDILTEKQDIYATAYEESPDRIAIIENKLSKNFGEKKPKLVVQACSCRDLLERYLV